MGCGHADATNAMGERAVRAGDLKRAAAAFLTAESLGSLAATVNRALAIVDPRSVVATPPAAGGGSTPADVAATLLAGSTGTTGGAGPRSTTTSTCTARLRLADVSKEDAARAFGFLDAAAHAGSTLALTLSGLCYATGLGVSRHAYQAFERFSVAAGRGHAAAQFALARCYGAGVGTAPSAASAATWLRRAAAGGSAEALNELGERHRDGAPAVGIPVDAARARRLFKAAADGGSAAGKMRVASAVRGSTLQAGQKAAGGGHPRHRQRQHCTATRQCEPDVRTPTRHASGSTEWLPSSPQPQAAPATGTPPQIRYVRQKKSDCSAAPHLCSSKINSLSCAPTAANTRTSAAAAAAPPGAATAGGAATASGASASGMAARRAKRDAPSSSSGGWGVALRLPPPSGK